MLTSFDDLRRSAIQSEPLRVAVAGGNDFYVIEAVSMALKDNLVSHAIITGDRDMITGFVSADLHDRIDIRAATTPAECADMAVAAVRADEADVLMKGHVDSTSYLRAVVNRDTGIRQGVLSNVTVAEMPSYPKLLTATDNGILPVPNLDQKRQIILNTAPLFRGLGITTAKVAALAATEKKSDALPATIDAAALTGEAVKGDFPGFVVDGPFGYDVAVSATAAKTKGLGDSLVAGDADLLLFSNIEAANAVAKAWKFHGQADTGSIVLGAKVPVLLNSRSDGAGRRINALLLAAIVKKGMQA
ncbi:phosphate butyryltransferase [Rhodobacteraceae bacterium B1Z28]|uniref:Phosphate butyryltransferase n=1 Tax=Ruegeria haliotis TaxID=2747601 RepID=A0ABX2PUR4_9RHOB|nr:phosphate acyltransferase [Ruegeria haliotis]NVO57425.1 phosphate butyryltransferase [Ruegeria haliotis]